MIETELKKELQYLEQVSAEINGRIFTLNNKVQTEKQNIDEQKTDFRGTANLSGNEKNALFDDINKQLLALEEKQIELSGLNKMKNSPYFGRVDLVEDNGELFNNYIGYRSLAKPKGGFYVLDWRAPAASFFYDYEKGKVKYKTPEGTFKGEILNKRQYKIRNEKLVYAFDSDIKVDDDILQEALLSGTNEKMKNIVTTIQREQNRIIRSSEKEDVVVLGVAGSGKTSVALHRIAYLLYKMRGKLNSAEVLILSPNKVFSNYISEVLPELNEQNAIETTLHQIAVDELKLTNLETKQEQMERLLSGYEAGEEFTKKSSYPFFTQLYAYVVNELHTSFLAKDIKLGEIKIAASSIKRMYSQYTRFLPFTAINHIIDNLVDSHFASYKNILPKIIEFLRQKLYSMFAVKNPIKLYSNFLIENEMKFSYYKGKIKQEDVYPVLTIHYLLYGNHDYSRYKHLVIDEMQDYNAVQWFIISSFFTCPKTILGDVNQSISVALVNNAVNRLNKLLFKNPDNFVLNFRAVNENINTLTLTKSYRSTYEISRLAGVLMGDIEIESVHKGGEKPELVKCSNLEEFISFISEKAAKYASNYKNVAIITKTQKQAKQIYNAIKEKVPVKLINHESDSFENGVLVLSAFESKGLEFDAVITFNTNTVNFHTKQDKHLLYIAVTRALHELCIVYSGKPTRFVKKYFN